MSKLLAGAAAAALLFQPAANAVHGGEAADSIAADADISQYEKGDVNCDGQIKISDLVLLQKWLIGAGDTELNVSETADICEDGRVDIFDLTALRRLLLGKIKGLDKKAPVSELAPAMSGMGRSRLPVFAVEFPDHCADTDFAEQVKQNCFGAEDKDESFYPLESVPAYFDRASYGKMYLECDVMSYRAKNPAESYIQNNSLGLAEEIMSEYAEKLDLSVYDANRDDILDSMVIIVPEKLLEMDNNGDKIPDWWPFSAKYYGSDTYGGMKLGSYCVIPYWKNDRPGTNSKIAHELCHAMGLTDYYGTNQESGSDIGSMSGSAGSELMDEGSGDLSAFSKLMLGWIAEEDIQFYTGGEQSFTLNSSQQKPSCILIPRDSEKGLLGEYFVIEFTTGEGNNSACFINGLHSTLFQKSGGVRILHCNAEVSDGVFGRDYKYSINSPDYDKTDEKQRVMRLVNDSGMFYPGVRGLNYRDVIDSANEEFRWYDEEGGLTVDTGLKVKISELRPDPNYEPDPFSGADAWGGDERHLANDPDYLSGASYTITISQVSS